MGAESTSSQHLTPRSRSASKSAVPTGATSKRSADASCPHVGWTIRQDIGGPRLVLVGLQDDQFSQDRCSIERAQVHAIRAPALVPVLVPRWVFEGYFGEQGISRHSRWSG